MLVSLNKIIGLCCACLMLLTANVSARGLFANDDVIWEASRNVFVKYAAQDDSRFGANDHPVQLIAEDIGKAFAALELAEVGRSDSNQSQAPVFTDQQVATLSRHLATGLSAAEPDQDILFSLERVPRRSFGLRGDSLFVAGRAFYKDGRLNLILGEHDRTGDKGFEAVYDPTHVGIVSFNFDHGRRTVASSNFRKNVAEVQGVESKQVNGGRRNDWLVLDLQQASVRAAVKAQTRRQEELLRRQRELRELAEQTETYRRDNTPQSAPAQRAASPGALPASADPTAPDIAIAVPAQVPSAPAHAVPLPASPEADIERRLETLKRLREKDLISEEAYQIRMAEILREL